jgi:hypothetical protein
VLSHEGDGLISGYAVQHGKTGERSARPSAPAAACDFHALIGLPPRPAGRIWLLRAPEPYGTAQDVLDDIWDGWQTSGGPAMATPEFVHYAQSRLHEIF